MPENASLDEFFDAREEMSLLNTSNTNATRETSSYATAQIEEETSVAAGSVAVASVTAAEPIDDDEDSQLHDSQIPTIRLSSLGGTLEKDFDKVRAELDILPSDSYDEEEGSGALSHFSDENIRHMHSSSNSVEKGRCLISHAPTKVQEVSDSRSGPVSPQESEEFAVEHTLQTPLPRPEMRRMISSDGVVAEFDLNGGDVGVPSDESNAPDDVMAQAVEIDASFRSMSMRSMEDLELGDEEPLPYPGRRQSSSRSGSRVNSEPCNRAGSGTLLGSAIGTHARAELLSATVIKNSPTEQIGINLLRDETVVYSISRGEEDEGSSLLRNCPFQAGDRLLSVNNKRTQHMDSSEVARMLREASGFITIVVHNPGGDPCLHETMITKANRNQRSGMGLKSTGARDLRVSSINENGLFAQSLLNVGDRILSINEVDVTEVDARVACDIIKNAPDRVTVVARTAHTTGVVVAEVSTRGLRSSFSEHMLTAVPESGSATNSGDEIEAVDDAFQMTRQQREQLFMGLCLILIVVAIMAGIFGRNSEPNPNSS